MKSTLIVFFISVSLMFFVGSASAMSYVCTNGAAERIITVVYDIQGSNVPCEVVYQKEDHSIQGLWRAKNTEGYCEGKAAEFAQKLKGLGWQCEMVTDSFEPATESDPAQ